MRKMIVTTFLTFDGVQGRLASVLDELLMSHLNKWPRLLSLTGKRGSLTDGQVRMGGWRSYAAKFGPSLS